jgi:hypothetical protein
MISNSAIRYGFVIASCLLISACGGSNDSPGSSLTSVTNTSAKSDPIASETAALGPGPTNPIVAISETAAAAKAATPAPVVLPLEVLGATGDTVTVTVSAPTGATAKKLYLQVNNLSYDNKGSVSINGGAWVALTNASVTIQGSGAYYGGIGGGFDTLKMTVPIKGAINGNNTISFRFNNTDGISSGFRVLAFNLQNAAGSNLIYSGFSRDDPTKWTIPLNDSADIAAGKQLYQNATLTQSSLNSTPIKAHCMDCHTANGSDLQRFNYSNYSIMTRSQFHGLSSTQGLQIASYIRSLTASLGVPGPNCRPWNPPYQPGPGLDAGNVKNWACGAGLTAVSDNDADTLASIFPNGVNKAAIASGSQINLRQIPIGLQLPDWNHWIPRIHPIDAWGSYFTSSNLMKEYAGQGTGPANWNLRTNLTNGGTAYAIGNFSGDDYAWGTAFGEQFSPPNEGTPGTFTVAQQNAIYGTVQWMLVKQWEMSTDFNLETLCPKAWTAIGGTKVEPRGWCSYWRFAFDVSPHVESFPPDNSMFGSAVAHYTRANQWYQMQILLNPGNGAHQVHLPVDWQYAYGLITNLRQASGRPEPMRELLYNVKGMQEMDNGKGVTNVDVGWTTRDTSPLSIWDGGQQGAWAGTPAATEQSVVNAYLETWLDRTTSFDVNTWQRIGPTQTNGDGNWCGWSIRSLCWSNYIPNTLEGDSPTLENFPTWSNTMIPQMRTDGISGTDLNRFATWLSSAYPNGGYQALIH